MNWAEGAELPLHLHQAFPRRNVRVTLLPLSTSVFVARVTVGCRRLPPYVPVDLLL
jgi:hypothetical protein